MFVKQLSGVIRTTVVKSREEQIILPSEKGLHRTVKNWPKG